MPTLPDLGRALGEHLLASTPYEALFGDQVRGLLEQGQIPSGNVEMWLSSLAEPQPFVSLPRGTLNLALFQEISRQLVHIVADAQEGFWKGAPTWLHRLLRLWHRRRVAVVTFNYDTIVEQAMVALDPPHEDGDIVAAMLAGIPKPAAPFSLGGDVRIATLRLIKLHGSLDWFWNPDDRSGDSLCRRTPSLTPWDEHVLLAGKSHFIVPPLATKAPFYSLGLLRLLWEEASRALQAAKRITVLGYSVPLTDLATTAMLSQNANPHAEWHIVDPKGRGVRARLIQLGIAPSAIEITTSVKKWVDQCEADHCRQMTADLLEQLVPFRNSMSDTRPIVVKWSRTDYRLIQGIRRERGNLLLEAQAQPLPSIIPADVPHEVDLVSALTKTRPPGPVSIRVDGLPGERRVLGALDPVTARGQNAVLDWCVLEVQDAPSEK